MCIRSLFKVNLSLLHLKCYGYGYVWCEAVEGRARVTPHGGCSNASAPFRTIFLVHLFITLGTYVRNLLYTARHVRWLSFMPRACGTCLTFLFGSGTLFARRGMKGVGCAHVMIYIYNAAHTLASLVSFRANGLWHARMHARKMLWLTAHGQAFRQATDVRSGARRLPAV